MSQEEQQKPQKEQEQTQTDHISYTSKTPNYQDKVILSLIEEITLYDAQGKSKRLLAKIDTGADSSSIDISLAGELMLGPITKTKSVVSSHGRSLRPVVPISLILGEKKVSGDFTLYNRTHMTFKVLIGRNILEKGFLIDPSKNSYAGMNRKDVTNLEHELAQEISELSNDNDILVGDDNEKI